MMNRYANHLRSAVRFLVIAEMTPTAARILEDIADEWDREEQS